MSRIPSIKVSSFRLTSHLKSNVEKQTSKSCYYRVKLRLYCVLSGGQVLSGSIRQKRHISLSFNAFVLENAEISMYVDGKFFGQFHFLEWSF